MKMHLDERYALMDVTLVDGRGRAPREHVTVVVERGDIAAVYPVSDHQRVDGLQEVDCAGCFVTPGLIDAHVHLAGGRAGMEDQELGVLMEPKHVRTIRSVADAQALLKRGFTAVRDISWNGLYLKRVFREGSLAGPKVIACGPGLCRTGGHGDAFQYDLDYVERNHFWAVLADGPDEIRKWVRRLLREGADQIKVWASGGDNWANDRNIDQHYTLEELRVAVAEAHMQQGTMVCSHAENLRSARDSVAAGADTIEHGEELDEALCEQMAALGIILVPTLELLVTWFTSFVATEEAPIEHLRPQVFLHRDVDRVPDADYGRRYAQRVMDNLAMAREKGVKIALGSDTVFTPLTPYGEYSAREFKALARCGMTTLEALTAATYTAAEALGMMHRIGSVEPGKAADLLVVTKDPTGSAEVLYDAGNLRWVILNGRLAVEEGRLAY
jgi:imidazolonepropionase-like amidohydrolase